jgi:hypothetical protein
MSPTDRITDALSALDGIPLAQADARAGLLARVESKFIVPASVVEAALRVSRGHFDILEIDQCREFGYETRYFDDDGYSSYFAHHKDRRRRFKVRTRTYLHTGIAFAEIKLKWRRGLTVKRRLAIDRSKASRLDPATLSLLSAAHETYYGRPLERPLRAVLDVRYRRMTLVSREEACRVTFDSALAFTALDRVWTCPDTMFVVEVKSTRHASRSRAMFRALGQRPVRRLSKYCVGLAASGVVPAGCRVRAATHLLSLAPR